MGSEWQSSDLTELCSLIKRGIGPKYCENEGVIVINQRCIRDQVVTFENSRLTDISKKKIPGDRYLESFDILVNSTGVGTLGRVAQLKEVDIDMTVDSHVTIVRGKSEEIDKKYLGYVLKAKEKEIEFLGEGSTGQTELSRHRLGELQIDYPLNFSEQKAIAHILGTLDDKIELNRKMNETLEEMAQALFKSWFADFDPVIDKAIAAGNSIPEPLQANAEKRKALGEKRKDLPQEIADLFPDRFVFTEELGWVPEGWEVKKIADLADVIGGGTPSTKNEDYWIGNGIPWLSPKDLSGYQWKFISRGAKDISQEGLQKSSARLLPKGSILFSSRAPIGYLAISENEVSTNQGFKSLVPEKGIYKDFLFYCMKYNVDYIESISSGSTFKEVSGRNIKELNVVKANDEILNSFSKLVEPNNGRLLQLQNETNKLMKIRDSLLPKLISGELRVPKSLNYD